MYMHDFVICMYMYVFMFMHALFHCVTSPYKSQAARQECCSSNSAMSLHALNRALSSNLSKIEVFATHTTSAEHTCDEHVDCPAEQTLVPQHCSDWNHIF